MGEVNAGGRGFPDAETYRGLKLVIFDVDGVLTDGRIIMDSSGVETKCFDVQDGAGLTLLRLAGLERALMTGRRSSITEMRAKDLKIPLENVRQGVTRKEPVFEEFLEQFGVKVSEVAYMGDDIIDLAVMRRVAVACCPSNGRPEVKAAAHAVATAQGGRGAVRDLCEHLLKQRDDGSWERLLELYLRTDV